jgi:hypothetical protein
MSRKNQSLGRKKTRRRTGRPFKHGGYSLILKDEILKEHPRLKAYLEDSRTGLVKDVAGTEEALSEQQRIMIDRIVSRLSICRLIEVYIEKYGAFRRDRLHQDRVLELEPALGQNYLAFSNSIDRALIALGLERKQIEPELTIAEVIREFDQEKERKAKAEKKRAEKAKTQAQGKASDDGEIGDPGASGEENSGGQGEGHE